MKPPKWLRKFGWNSWGPIAFTRLIRFEVYQENKWEKENNPSGVMPKDDILCSFNSQCRIVTLFPSSKAKRSFCNARLSVVVLHETAWALNIPAYFTIAKTFRRRDLNSIPKVSAKGQKQKSTHYTHFWRAILRIQWVIVCHWQEIYHCETSFPQVSRIFFYFILFCFP